MAPKDKNGEKMGSFPHKRRDKGSGNDLVAPEEPYPQRRKSQRLMRGNMPLGDNCQGDQEQNNKGSNKLALLEGLQIPRPLECVEANHNKELAESGGSFRDGQGGRMYINCPAPEEIAKDGVAPEPEELPDTLSKLLGHIAKTNRKIYDLHTKLQGLIESEDSGHRQKFAEILNDLTEITNLHTDYIKLIKESIQSIISRFKENVGSEGDDDPLTKAVKESDAFNNPNFRDVVSNALQEYQVLKSTPSGINAKLSKWLKTVAYLPVGKYSPTLFEADASPSSDSTSKNISALMDNAVQILDDVVYGMRPTKNAILEMLVKHVICPTAPIGALLIDGPPGCGKTTIATKAISKIMKRPAFVINAGGLKSSETLLGHNFTYEGSGPGRIVQFLIHAGLNDIIIVFDEVDKISKTPNGKELIHVLMSLTDPIRNHSITDNYLDGLPMDLSRAIFVFTCNSVDEVDRTVLDRLRRVPVIPLTTDQKIHTTERYIIPLVAKEMGLNISNSIDGICTSSKSPQGGSGGYVLLPEDAIEVHSIVSKIVEFCEEDDEAERKRQREQEIASNSPMNSGTTMGTGMRNVLKFVDRLISSSFLKRIRNRTDCSESDMAIVVQSQGPLISMSDVDRTIRMINEEKEEARKAHRDECGLKHPFMYS